MSELRQEIITIDNINDREEVLNILSDVYTDEDFCGNNGEDFTWEEALEEGFESTQDYVIDKLRKSDLNGIDLVQKFLSEWLDNDGYYTNWEVDYAEDGDKYVVACAITTGD